MYSIKSLLGFFASQLEIESLKAQVREYTDHFAVVECSEEEIKCFLAESSRKAAAARATEAQQSRKLACVERRLRRAVEEKEQLLDDKFNSEKRLKEKLSFLERFKVMRWLSCFLAGFSQE